jgi:hypothetical protein
MRRNLSILLPIIVIIIVAGHIILFRPMTVYRMLLPWSHEEVIEKVFKDQEIFDVMMNSPQVTAQRLHWSTDRDPDLLSGYTRDMPVTLTVRQTQQIKNLLQSPWSYLWDVASCGPNYGVLYNFESGGHTVHVAFCFRCNIIGIFDGDNDASNRINFTSQFNPMRQQVVILSKALFSNDKEIQALQYESR